VEVRMRGSKLFIGNIDYSVTKEQLKELFSGYGSVTEVKIIEGKGFGFVEMSSQSEAEKAKGELNGSYFNGRTLKVDEAHPQRNRYSRDNREYRGRR
jgi:RNA recognition motif-containing protein